MDLNEFVGLVRCSPALTELRGGPLDRRDLQDRLDVSRPTIHRHVKRLEGAELIEKDSNEFVLTPMGEIVAGEFAELLSVMDNVTSLRRALRWLPVEELAFDLALLRSAEIVVPDRTNPVAPIRRAATLIADADRVRVVSHTVPPEVLAVIRRHVVEGESFEAVLDPGLVETILAEDDVAEHFEAMLAGGAHVAVAPESVPIIMGIADETVMIGAVDEGGGPQALVVTDDEEVRAWAEQTADRYLDRAEPVAIEAETRPTVTGTSPDDAT